MRGGRHRVVACSCGKAVTKTQVYGGQLGGVLHAVDLFDAASRDHKTCKFVIVSLSNGSSDVLGTGENDVGASLQRAAQRRPASAGRFLHSSWKAACDSELWAQTSCQHLWPTQRRSMRWLISNTFRCGAFEQRPQRNCEGSEGVRECNCSAIALLGRYRQLAHLLYHNQKAVPKTACRWLVTRSSSAGQGKENRAHPVSRKVKLHLPRRITHERPSPRR
jgi:hypothetical protein